jgi:hypothetical protein
MINFSTLPDEIIVNEMFSKFSLHSLMNLRCTDKRLRDLVDTYFINNQKLEYNWSCSERIYFIQRCNNIIVINEKIDCSDFGLNISLADVERWFFKRTMIQFNKIYIYYEKGFGWTLFENNKFHEYRKIKIGQLARYLVSFIIDVDVSEWMDYEIYFYTDGYLLGGYNFYYNYADDLDELESTEDLENSVDQWIHKMISRESCITIVQ